MGIKIPAFKQKTPKAMAGGGLVKADGTISAEEAVQSTLKTLPEGHADQDEDKDDKGGGGGGGADTLGKLDDAADAGDEAGLAELLGLAEGGVVKAEEGGTPVIL